MTTNILDNIKLEDQTIIYNEIIDAVDIHCKAIKLVSNGIAIIYSIDCNSVLFLLKVYRLFIV